MLTLFSELLATGADVWRKTRARITSRSDIYKYYDAFDDTNKQHCCSYLNCV